MIEPTDRENTEDTPNLGSNDAYDSIEERLIGSGSYRESIYKEI